MRLGRHLLSAIAPAQSSSVSHSTSERSTTLHSGAHSTLAPAPLTEGLAVHGTRDDDTIHVITSPVLWCGLILQPVTQNGHAIRLLGGEGDDELHGGGSAPFSGNPNAVYGERAARIGCMSGRAGRAPKGGRATTS